MRYHDSLLLAGGCSHSIPPHWLGSATYARRRQAWHLVTEPYLAAICLCTQPDFFEVSCQLSPSSDAIISCIVTAACFLDHAAMFDVMTAVS